MPATVTPLLSRTQTRILSAIRGYATEHGYAPSIREVADVCGMSVSSVQYQLGQLNEKGWIRRAPGRSRAIVVLDPATGQA
uniref:LexA family protein n=1 Tax=Paractinoplanes polyasparticus TaxID=2856853 RepID=UPI001C844D93|nr:MarR family transcriptional regulator [Actinoplanes polyasparticus]